MEVNKIIQGDCLEVLKTLPDKSVDCMITSPPYWGLRDYGTAKWEDGDIECNHRELKGSILGEKSDTFHGSKTQEAHYIAYKDICKKCGAKRVDAQLGLEKTPEEYVAKMVGVFKEVKRVLKKEGTCWLNLGDSYNSHSTGQGNVGGIEGKRKNKCDNIANTYRQTTGLKDKDLVGIPWRVAFALQQPYEEHLIKDEVDRAYIAGLVDGEGCITIQRTKSSHSESFSFPPIVQIRMCDTEAIDYFAKLIGVKRSEEELYNSQKDANQRPSYNVKATADKAMALIGDIYPYLKVKRKQAIVAWNHQMFRSNRGNGERKKGELEKEQFCKDLINKLNQKEEVQLPDWMIEPKVETEPGWYLRQDLIWAKPNPMPESVTDRCTKSHEYIFLLTKSPKYYFDNEAIKEPNANPERTNYTPGSRTNGENKDRNDNDFAARVKKKHKNLQEDGQEPNTIHLRRAEGLPEADYVGRNKRSVWIVTTKPFAEAHFATFPEELIGPMIMAGCPKGGLVLDIFMGAGTTAVVAKILNRNYLGIELNPAYIKIAEERIKRTGSPLF